MYALTMEKVESPLRVPDSGLVKREKNIPFDNFTTHMLKDKHKSIVSFCSST
jgi:hypothetical protein